MATSELPKNADSRNHPRVEPTDQTAVTNAHSGSVMGQLVNISIDGLMLMGPSCITPGSVCQLRIPVRDGEQTRELLVGAEALWCQDANDSGSHWSGFQIIDISPEDLDFLSALVGG